MELKQRNPSQARQNKKKTTKITFAEEPAEPDLISRFEQEDMERGLDHILEQDQDQSQISRFEQGMEQELPKKQKNAHKFDGLILSCVKLSTQTHEPIIFRSTITKLLKYAWRKVCPPPLHAAKLVMPAEDAIPDLSSDAGYDAALIETWRNSLLILIPASISHTIIGWLMKLVFFNTVILVATRFLMPADWGGGTFGKMSNIKHEENKIRKHYIVGRTSFWDSLLSLTCVLAVMLTISSSIHTFCVFFWSMQVFLLRKPTLSKIFTTITQKNMESAMNVLHKVEKENTSGKSVFSVNHEEIDQHRKQHNKKFYNQIAMIKGSRFSAVVMVTAYIVLVSAAEQYDSVEMHWHSNLSKIPFCFMSSEAKQCEFFSSIISAFMPWEWIQDRNIPLVKVGLNAARSVDFPGWMDTKPGMAIASIPAYIWECISDSINIKAACTRTKGILHLQFCQRKLLFASPAASAEELAKPDDFANRMTPTGHTMPDPLLFGHYDEVMWANALKDVRPCKDSCEMLIANNTMSGFTKFWITLVCSIIRTATVVYNMVYSSCGSSKLNQTEIEKTAEKCADFDEDKAACNMHPNCLSVFGECKPRRPAVLQSEKTYSIFDNLSWDTVCQVLNGVVLTYIVAVAGKASWKTGSFVFKKAALAAAISNPVTGPAVASAMAAKAAAASMQPAIKKTHKFCKNKTMEQIMMITDATWGALMRHLTNEVNAAKAVTLNLLPFRWASLSAWLSAWNIVNASAGGSRVTTIQKIALYWYIMLKMIRDDDVKCELSKLLHLVFTGTDRVVPYDQMMFFRSISKTQTVEKSEADVNSDEDLMHTKYLADNNERRSPYRVDIDEIKSLKITRTWTNIFERAFTTIYNRAYSVKNSEAKTKFECDEDQPADPCHEHTGDHVCYKGHCRPKLSAKILVGTFLSNQIIPVKYGIHADRVFGVCKISPPRSEKSMFSLSSSFSGFVSLSMMSFFNSSGASTDGYHLAVHHEHNQLNKIIKNFCWDPNIKNKQEKTPKEAGKKKEAEKKKKRKKKKKKRIFRMPYIIASHVTLNWIISRRLKSARQGARPLKKACALFHQHHAIKYIAPAMTKQHQAADQDAARYLLRYANLILDVSLTKLDDAS